MEWQASSRHSDDESEAAAASRMVRYSAQRLKAAKGQQTRAVEAVSAPRRDVEDARLGLQERERGWRIVSQRFIPPSAVRV